MQRTSALTLAYSWWPRVGLRPDVVRVVLGSVVIALCAQISIPLQPVPITGQTLGVLLAGAVLGSRLGALSVLLYLAEGLAGLPVFSSGANAWTPTRLPGIPYILGPTAGYLLGFLPAAYVVGWLAERGWDRRVLTAALAMAIGNVIVYAVGLAWLSRFPLPVSLFAAGLLPFLPGDALKIALAAAALPGAWALTRRDAGSPPGAGEHRI